MTERLVERVGGVLRRAVEEVNLQLPPAERLGVSPEERVLADGTRLDSLGFVSLVVAIEQEIEKEFGEPYSLLVRHEPSPENAVYACLGSIAVAIADDLASDT